MKFLAIRLVKMAILDKFVMLANQEASQALLMIGQQLAQILTILGLPLWIDLEQNKVDHPK